MPTPLKRKRPKIIFQGEHFNVIVGLFLLLFNYSWVILNVTCAGVLIMTTSTFLINQVCVDFPEVLDKLGKVKKFENSSSFFFRKLQAQTDPPLLLELRIKQ